MLSRRTLLASASAAALRGQGPRVPARQLAEFRFTSIKPRLDPFNEVELDLLVEGPAGQHRIPAFWAGGSEWRARYAPPLPGHYRYHTIATDTSDHGLHAVIGSFDIAPPIHTDNPLIKHGPLRVAPDRRHFEHTDGTPFFWLADTWWMGLCRRLRWPADFERLAADRLHKGFTVVQIIAGLYPDMPAFDPRGANEAGFPWEPGYARINPLYFDMADRRIEYLVAHGLAPCIVGCWGYFLPWMGLAKVKQHWRNLVARWGAYPVFWCLAGEGTMPYYLSATKRQDAEFQKHGLTELARYVRSIDPLHHPITIHPSSSARECVDDATVLDFDMLQTGHGDRQSIPGTVRQVTTSLTREPRMPVVDGEVCYEGIMEASRQEVQRFMFWSCVLSGAAGHTYGANGIWQVNRAGEPYGPSPHGRSWGDTPWDVAMELPGSAHLGIAKALLMRYPWWRLEPHPEWVEPHWSEKNYQQPFAAGIPGELRIIFIPPMWNPPKVKSLEPGASYRAFYFDPTSGREKQLGPIAPDASGTWQPPIQPTFADWVLVLACA
jgi:hypothetical protein